MARRRVRAGASAAMVRRSRRSKFGVTVCGIRFTPSMVVLALLVLNGARVFATDATLHEVLLVLAWTPLCVAIQYLYAKRVYRFWADEAATQAKLLKEDAEDDLFGLPTRTRAKTSPPFSKHQQGQPSRRLSSDAKPPATAAAASAPVATSLSSAEQEQRGKIKAIWRGSRDILLIMERSKNGNVVVYEAKRQGGQDGPLHPTSPATVYWMDIDPAYQAKNRKKGVQSDRSDLNVIEKKMAYGINCSVDAAKGQGHFQVKLVAMPSRPLSLSLDEKGTPRLRCTLDGHSDAVLRRIYVKAKEPTGFGAALKLPSVEYVQMEGYFLRGSDKVPCMERVKP